MRKTLVLLALAVLPLAGFADVVIDLRTSSCTFQWGLNSQADHNTNACAILTGSGDGSTEAQGKGQVNEVDRRLVKFDVGGNNHYVVQMPCSQYFDVIGKYIDRSGQTASTYNCTQRIEYIGFANGRTGGTVKFAIKLFNLSR